MKHYVVIFDNCVTEDVVIKHYYEEDAEKVWDKAYEYSRNNTYLSEGNFTIYKEVV